MDVIIFVTIIKTLLMIVPSCSPTLVKLVVRDGAWACCIIHHEVVLLYLYIITNISVTSPITSLSCLTTLILYWEDEVDGCLYIQTFIHHSSSKSMCVIDVIITSHHQHITNSIIKSLPSLPYAMTMVVPTTIELWGRSVVQYYPRGSHPCPHMSCGGHGDVQSSSIPPSYSPLSNTPCQ